MANSLAIRLDRDGVAEMSCIAGVGGDVPALLKTAHSGRSIVALDGCPLACVKSCLARHGLAPDRHHQLHTHGVRKRQHEDFDPVQAQQVLAQVSAGLHRLAVAAATALSPAPETQHD